MNCTGALTHREGGALARQAFDLAADAAHHAGLMRQNRLGGEFLDVLWAALPIGHPLIPEHAHRLAGIRTRDDSVFIGRIDDHLFVEAAGMRFRARNEARAHPHALRT